MSKKIKMLEHESFLDKLRKKYGRIQPGPFTIDESSDFDAKYRKELPFRFFLLETLPDFLGKVKRKTITFPLRDLKFWILHRTIMKFHVVKTNLEPGYYDKDMIMMHALFSILVDFVEIENASVPTKEEVQKDKSLRGTYWKSKLIPAYHLIFRSAERGVQQLEERIRLGEAEIDEVTLETGFLPEHAQHLKASVDTERTILELYRWWTVERPQQHAEIENISPMAEFRKKVGKDDMDGLGVFSKRLQKKYPEAFDTLKTSTMRQHELEKMLREEDEEMITKLIAIRRSLWT